MSDQPPSQDIDVILHKLRLVCNRLQFEGDYKKAIEYIDSLESAIANREAAPDVSENPATILCPYPMTPVIRMTGTMDNKDLYQVYAETRHTKEQRK